MFDIVSIGDCTIDAFVDLLNAEVEMHGESQTIRIPFATKIPIKDRVRQMPAGNSNNNAIGSARLGLETAFFTVVGDDSPAQIIIKNLQHNGVATSLVHHDPRHGTNFHVALSYGPERTLLIYHEAYIYHLPTLHTQWAYFSSVGRAGARSLGDQVTEQVREGRIKLALNPGTFQLELGQKGLIPILKQTEILFVNKEEAELLLGLGITPFSKLLTDLHKLGPRTIVITDGPKGSYASDGTDQLFLEIFADLPAVERTGAGDAYATAFAAARILGQPLAEAMRWGTFNSGSVLGQVGPQEGLLTRKELDVFLKKNPDFQPRPLSKVRKKA